MLPILAGSGSSPLASGSASTTFIGSGTASVACTAPTGGTAPYTYQWQRSTTGGGVGFSNITGATSQTYNDAGLTNGTVYYYRCVQTDSAGTPATVTSNETPASPYAGAATQVAYFMTGRP